MPESNQEFGICEPDWFILKFEPQIPADYLGEAIANPNAVRLAYNLGLLEFLGLSLTVLGVTIAVLALFGFWVVRQQAISAAKNAAEEAIPQEVLEYMRGNIGPIMRECLKNPEIVAGLQASIYRLGLDDAETAFDVDTDAEIKETDDV